MKEKVKAIAKSRYFRLMLCCCLVMSALVMSVSAADDSTAGSMSQITTAFTTGFQQMMVDSIALLSAMVPPAVSIGAVVFLVRKAMGWFKSIAK